MEVYKISIEYAIIIFPIIAFLLTLPFLIYQYHKYGSIPVLRSVIFYSFTLYIITAYFMVILPLPNREYVATLKTPTMQLIPFSFVGDILKETSFNINRISTYLPTLENSAIYTIIFNLFLTLPFGVYLRYYFNCKWYKVLIYSFLMSLFFELTQLSGLYGIYPRPYRLFDVDDLIINTLGGFFGYVITPIFMKILPSKEKLDNRSYEKGKKVTIFRRIIAFFVDMFFLALFIGIASIITYNSQINKYTSIIILTFYYLIFPLFNKGKTIGKIILKLKITTINEEDAKWYQILLRYFLGYFIIIVPSTLCLDPILKTSVINENMKFVIRSVISLYIIANYISLFITPFKKDKRILYEKITHTKDVSTIVYKDNKVSNDKNEIEKERDKNKDVSKEEPNNEKSSRELRDNKNKSRE